MGIPGYKGTMTMKRRPYETLTARFRKFSVDAPLRNEWLDRLNALPGCRLTSICYGHDGAAPHINLSSANRRNLGKMRLKVGHLCQCNIGANKKIPIPELRCWLTLLGFRVRNKERWFERVISALEAKE